MNPPTSHGAWGRALRPPDRSCAAAVLTVAALLTLVMTIAAFVLPSSVIPIAVSTVTAWALLLATAWRVRRQQRGRDQFVQQEAVRGIDQMERWLASQRRD
jgi:protein-S-isoprenylcysteine O-methyltransferase Ste14